MHICIFEDHLYTNFFPLVYFRPVFDLRCGALTLREKIEALFPRTRVILYMRSFLFDYFEVQHPASKINCLPEGDAWFINGRILADENLVKLIHQHKNVSTAYYQQDIIVAAYIKKLDILRYNQVLQSGVITPSTFKGIPREPLTCRMVNYHWELMNSTADEIENDFKYVRKFRKQFQRVNPRQAGVHFVNKKHISIGKNSSIMPGVVLDASQGPIILGKNVRIMPNVVIEGPVYIGDDSVIKIGAKIYHGTSIGNHCKIGGEVESSTVLSYSNKQHDGYLGHSYLGSWINIGAGTNTSDLKNTYGTIKVTINGINIDTNSQFVGLIMGDHSKTGITTMFNSGTIVGASCNVYGSGFQPKLLPSFSWGEPGSFREYSLGKSIVTAQRMMQRRNIELTPAYEQIFRAIFSETENERRSANIK